MTKQKVFCLLAAAGLLTNTGCYCLNNLFCCPGGYGGPVGYGVAEYGGGSCGGCESGCDACARPCFPLLQKVFRGMHAIKRCVFCHGNCGGGCDGCGEKYWSEWHNDPPNCNDSCDGCGNWTGCRCGVYQAPYNVAPYAEPQGVPTEAAEPPASQAGYRMYEPASNMGPMMGPNMGPTMAPAGYRSYRHPGRIAVGI